MAKKSQTPLSANDNELDGFSLQVEQVLIHFASPDWIGAHSPLAAPYFLGRALLPSAPGDDARRRGQSLQPLLLQAAAQMESEPGELLKVVYFERNPQLENVGLALALNLSERTFYRMRVRAIQTLAQRLNQILNPPLRAEMPSRRDLVGRAEIMRSGLAILLAGGSLYLSGPSGVGKTTVGGALVRQWLVEKGQASARNGVPQKGGAQPPNERHFFWYTLRGGLNDQTASLLFALGYFLRGLGADYTWRQLVADRGVANAERILALLRYDLHSLSPDLPLLCIDEVDALQLENQEHAQILHLLEELRSQTPLLLMGQQALLEADQHLRLAGLDEIELDGLLARANPASTAASSGAEFTPEVRQQLLAYSRGNPALLLLFVALVRDGDAAEAALQSLAKAPSLEALFHRIWRRLPEAERQLLMELAVFRNPVPQDGWRSEAALLERLRQRELIDFDPAGAMRCDPRLQRLVQERIPVEHLPLLHSNALAMREDRAEYLPAVYHAIESRQWARAVWLWFVHRNEEIANGGGSQALALLKRISPADLSDERDRTALRIARAELYQLGGQWEEAEAELQATTTAGHSASRAYVRRFEGHALDSQGRVEEALEKYRQSLDALTGLPQLGEVIVRSRLSFLQLYRLHNVDAARNQALLARARADSVLGDVEIMAGHYDAALELLLSAKRNAEEGGGDLVTLSHIYSFLGRLYLQLGEYDNALHEIDQAIECDRKRGDEVGPLYDLLNRANVHLLAGRFEQSLADAQEGLAVAERVKHSYLTAGLAAGVAEAYCELAQWPQAEHFALYSLNQEEEFFRAPALVILGRVRRHEGNHAEAIRLLAAAVDNCKQIEDRHTEAYVWRTTGLVEREEGRLEEARAAFAQAQQIYESLGLAKEVAGLQTLLAEVV